MDISSFIAKWKRSSASERANKDTFLVELCDVLGVPRPDPATGDLARDRYVFEKPIPTAHEGGKLTVKRVDLYKHGCFLLEAKQGGAAGGRKAGTARRGTATWDLAMDDARGQALGYATSLDDPPPFLIVCDIGHMLELHADFDGSRRWHPFPNAQRSRIYLDDLAQHVDLLRAVWTEPLALDPARRAVRVTREVAASLGDLARRLEAEGNPPESVAQFLMRCVFTMFAEDVGLLPERLFTDAIEKHWLPSPPSFPVGIQTLWEAMNGGQPFGFVGKLLRFNGGLFAQPAALALSREALEQLHSAAKHDWSSVEPSIFGTLLERALNPRERHMLGAHYTPRAYVERLVRPTIEEPLRTAWENIQTEARKLFVDGKEEEARKVVKAFHRRLSETRVLDPACGSGNFLYVTMDLFKRLESEVLALLHDLGERQELLHAATIRVTPAQFLGIEKKPWAKEIAELVLWIGYLQWHFRTHGRLVPPPEPVLQDYRNIECRDAVLAYDREELVRDERGKPVSRWDGETMKKHPVTGEAVPDEGAQVPIYRYVNPRKAEWPKAEFIIGNPPFIGGWRIRGAIGDGYVKALWSVHPDIPEKCDYVMYWWDHAAELVRAGEVRRFGFITTNSIVQVFQRRVLARHLDAQESPARIVFAVPDHPWVDSEDAAAVRVAMTAVERVSPEQADVILAQAMQATKDAEPVVLSRRVDRIGADLRPGVNLDAAKPLRANSEVCSPGVQLYGAGFILKPQETGARAARNPRTSFPVIRPYLNGRDLMAQPRGAYVIDFFGLEEIDAAAIDPESYQRLLVRVKPERDQNRRAAIRERWWRFGWERPVWRAASRGLRRFISTPETARHRVFIFLDAEVLPDNMLTSFALDDAFSFGVLSSRAHVAWCLAAGGRLGIGNDPRYTKSRCFDPFPFPDCAEAQKKRIRELGEALDAHRKRQQAAHPDLTITAMYNVLEKLRRDEVLTDKERTIHDKGLVSMLRRIHDDLDAAVFQAYGWPEDIGDEQILERVVALNAERLAEEEGGLVRWLRPDLQSPEAAQRDAQMTISGTDDEEPTATEATPAAPATIRPWPRKTSEQIAALRDRIQALRGAFTAADVAAGFKGARKKDLADLLDGLAALGLLIAAGADPERRWRKAARPAAA